MAGRSAVSDATGSRAAGGNSPRRAVVRRIVSQDDDRETNDRVASPLEIALTRWQHAPGEYWPFVCAAPFVSAEEKGAGVGETDDPSWLGGTRRAHGRAPLPESPTAPRLSLAGRPPSVGAHG